MVAIDARGHGNSSDAQQGDCRFDAAAADDDDVTLTRGDASTWVCAELARMRHRY